MSEFSRVALVSLPLSLLPESEEESEEESSLDPLELESEGGSGVLAAFFKTFLLSSSDSEEESDEESDEESEEESEESESEDESEDDSDEEELDESLSLLEDELEEESDEESEEVDLEEDLDETLVFLVLGASSESDPEEEDESDSAFRFVPCCLEAVEGAGAAALSSSSSASLSEPDDEDDEELLADFLDWDLGASFISTSDSLELLSLSSLSEESELELAEDLAVFVFPVWFSQLWKISSNEGTSLVSLNDLPACSFLKAVLVFVNPNSVKKAATEAIS